MKVEVYGKCNEDGSSHPLHVFEIEEGCERVLVTLPGFVRNQTEPKCWGFKNGKQVYGTLESFEPKLFIVG